MLRLLGYRLTCVLGSFLSTASFILTWLLMHLGVTSILPFYPVTGGLAGLGLGLLNMVGRAVINEWFDKRMGLATGLASSGSGMGQLALAPLLVLAMDRLGLSLTFLMLSAVTGSGALLGLTLTTPDNKKKMKTKEVDY